MKVYILDPGTTGLDKILNWLAENTNIKEVAIFKKPEVFLERVERERPEMVFVRLGCNDFPGLGIGQMIKAMDQDIRIVFIAEEKDYALDAYEVGAYGYLLCPVEKEKFDKVFCMLR